MRWIKQRNRFSCAPIAMLNIRKWAGGKISYQRNYQEMCRLCECSPESGSPKWLNVLESMSDLRITKLRFPLVGDVLRHLHQGIALIRGVPTWSEIPHGFLLAGVSEDDVLCVNIWRDKQATRWVPTDWLDKHYFLNRRESMPTVWLIEKAST